MLSDCASCPVTAALVVAVFMADVCSADIVLGGVVTAAAAVPMMGAVASTSVALMVLATALVAAVSMADVCPADIVLGGVVTAAAAVPIVGAVASTAVAPMVLEGVVLGKSTAGCVNTGSVCF